jgi:hypothetical protein
MICFKILVGILALPIMIFIDLTYFVLVGNDRLFSATKQIIDVTEDNLRLLK